MRKSVSLKITRCDQCPNLDTGMSYSLDGFDRGNDWKCKAANGKLIAGFVEWVNRDAPGIPDWCPLAKAKS